MVSYFTELIGLVCLVSVFFYAGITKIFNLSATTDSISFLPIFSSLPWFISLLATIIAIGIEIFAPILIIIAYFNHTLGSMYQYAIYSLIGFTILASLFFHPPSDQTQRVSFLKNIGLIGGFIIALDLHE